MESRVPSEVKMNVGCRDGEVCTVFVATPLGKMVLQCCPFGVHSLNLDHSVRDETFSPVADQRVSLFPSQDNQQDPTTALVVTEFLNWLDTYFHEPARLLQVAAPKMCWGSKGRTFSRNCLEQLPVIAEYGKMVSYSDLAAAAGNSNATRAAGGAVRQNPAMLLVPCHRVITKGGAMGKFSGGTRQKVKRWLLEHEGHSQFKKR